MAQTKKPKKIKIKLIKNPTGFCKLANLVGDDILLDQELANKLIANEYAVQL